MSKKPPFKTLSSTTIVQSRLEEQFDKAIFHCLHALTKRHPVTEEFRATFTRGAFLKPNTKAFIHVVHFLFNAYDPVEFRKRFYWPIFDKQAENAFRSSTVGYVNHLIELRKLTELKPIKAHVVVLPGGMKFMKFLLTIIRFVLREELRRTKGGTGGVVLSKDDLTMIVAEHQQWTDACQTLRRIVQEDAGVMKHKIGEINQLMAELLEGCSGLERQMSFEKCMELWGILIRKEFVLLRNRRKTLMSMVQQFEQVIVKARDKLEPRELSLSFDKSDLMESLHGLELLYPDNAYNFREVFNENGKINVFSLLRAVAILMPDIQRYLAGYSVRSRESIDFEHKELTKDVMLVSQLCGELAFLKRNLPMLTGSASDAKISLRVVLDDFAIRNKFFNTPPLRLNFDEGAPITVGGRRTRLALLDEDHIHDMNRRMKPLSQSKLCTPRSHKKERTHPNASSITLTNSKQFAVPKALRKEKFTAMTMLDRIKMQNHKANNQKPNKSASNNSTMDLSGISTLGDYTLRPALSSTLLGTPEKDGYRRRSGLLTTDTLSPKPTETPSKRFSNSPSVQSLITMETIRTSPSGRLGPLVGESTEPCIPTIMVSEALLAVDEADEFTDSTLKPEISNQSLNLSDTLVNMCRSKLMLNDRNDPGASPQPITDDDNLFNISDGVLTDFD